MTDMLDILKYAKRLPSIDWKLTFFGGHTQEVEAGWNVPENKHLAFELIYVISGIEDVFIDNTSYRLQEEELIIIPPNFPHKIQASSEKNLYYFCAHFDIDDPDFVTDMINYSDAKIDKENSYYAKIKIVIQQWIDLVENSDLNDFEKKMHIQILLSKFLLLLNNLIEDNKQKLKIKKNTASNIHYAKLISKKIRNELQHIWKDSNTQLTISDLSIQKIMEEIGINPAYGSTLFKEVYGISPKKYCSSLILEEAKNLLKISSLSIEEISDQLRFNSLANFSKQFKRWAKISPLQYRQKYYQTN